MWQLRLGIVHKKRCNIPSSSGKKCALVHNQTKLSLRTFWFHKPLCPESKCWPCQWERQVDLITYILVKLSETSLNPSQFLHPNLKHPKDYFQNHHLIPSMCKYGKSQKNQLWGNSEKQPGIHTNRLDSTGGDGREGQKNGRHSGKYCLSETQCSTQTSPNTCINTHT